MKNIKRYKLIVIEIFLAILEIGLYYLASELGSSNVNVGLVATLWLVIVFVVPGLMIISEVLLSNESV